MAQELIKAGELAKRAGIVRSVITFYIAEGILKVDSLTPGGWNLFDAQESLRRIKKIKQLQDKKRLTIAEIKEELEK